MLRKPVVTLAPAIMVSSLAMTLVSASGVSQVSTGARAAILDRFLAPEQQPLVSYRAIRRLTASTRGGRMQASIEAWTALDPTEGFKYKVIAEEGPAVIRRRVLIAALEAQVLGPKFWGLSYIASTSKFAPSARATFTRLPAGQSGPLTRQTESSMRTVPKPSTIGLSRVKTRPT